MVPSQLASSAAGHRGGDEDAHGQGGADGEGGYRTQDPVVGGHRDEHQHQDEGDEGLDEERPTAGYPAAGAVVEKSMTVRPSPLYAAQVSRQARTAPTS